DGTVTLVQLHRPAQLPWGGAAEGSRWGRMGERRRARTYESEAAGPARADRADLPWAATRAESVPGTWPGSGAGLVERAPREAGAADARRVPVERRSWPPDAAGVAGVVGGVGGAG